MLIVRETATDLFDDGTDLRACTIRYYSPRMAAAKGVDRAIDHAIDAAERYGATLHVLYVVDSDVVNAYSGDEFVDGSEGASETLEERGREALDEVASHAADAGVDVVTELVYGVPTRRFSATSTTRISTSR